MGQIALIHGHYARQSQQLRILQRLPKQPGGLVQVAGILREPGAARYHVRIDAGVVDLLGNGQCFFKIDPGLLHIPFADEMGGSPRHSPQQLQLVFIAPGNGNGCLNLLYRLLVDDEGQDGKLHGHGHHQQTLVAQPAGAFNGLTHRLQPFLVATHHGQAETQGDETPYEDPGLSVALPGQPGTHLGHGRLQPAMDFTGRQDLMGKAKKRRADTQRRFRVVFDRPGHDGTDIV